MSAPPESLQLIQTWFANIITQRLVAQDKINLKGGKIADEATDYIASSPTLKPHERLQIYNQQYWWRLKKTLLINYPLVARLVGLRSFNETICVPYLLAHPPSHWQINLVGQHLPQWIRQNYKGADFNLVDKAANLDWAFTASSIAPQLPFPDLQALTAENDPTKLLSYVFSLQPHLYFFEWDDNLFSFREKLLEMEIEKVKIPKLSKGKRVHFILYRNRHNKISYRQISKEEHFLLSQFKNGASLEKAFEVIEKQSESMQEVVATNLQQWLQDWVQMGLLG